MNRYREPLTGSAHERGYAAVAAAELRTRQRRFADSVADSTTRTLADTIFASNRDNDFTFTAASWDGDGAAPRCWECLKAVQSMNVYTGARDRLSMVPILYVYFVHWDASSGTAEGTRLCTAHARERMAEITARRMHGGAAE